MYDYFDYSDYGQYRPDENDNNGPFGGGMMPSFGQQQQFGPPFGQPFGQQQFGPPFGQPPFGQGGQAQFGSQSGPPSGPPPSIKPMQATAGVGGLGIGGPSIYKIDTGAIRPCRFRFVFIWLENGRSFWAWLTFVGRRSVAGWRWIGYRWVYFGVDLDDIQSFYCY